MKYQSFLLAYMLFVIGHHSNFGAIRHPSIMEHTYRTNPCFSISGASLINGHHSHQSRPESRNKTPRDSLKLWKTSEVEKSRDNPFSTRRIAPVAFQASDAHIHRIRSAASHADFKHNCKVASIQLPKRCTTSYPCSIDPNEEEEDVESVDWTAPLDITSYLYKPEYVKPKQSRENLSITSTERDFSKCTLPLDESGSEIEGVLPLLSDDVIKTATSIKKDLVECYIKSSMRGRKTDVVLDKRIHNCAAFAKYVKDDIREMKAETKRLELYSPRVVPWRESSKKEIVEKGYATLKRLYELNPDLTESAAQKNISGPPGNHWMDLSRVEILEIMYRIRKEFGVTKDENFPFYQERNLKHMKSRHKKNSGNKLRNKPKGKKHDRKCQSPKTPKMKLPQHTMPLHVPGPKHLHTNVCIRPWEATLDGWNHQEDHDDEDDVDGKVNSHNARFLRTPSPHPPFSSDDTEANAEDEWCGEREDFLTLEIFNPIFRVSR